ncbi:TetR/AcrR family transcriptional regulator [Streptomyces sp. NPDC003328]|uniref:TetR/AcrR family transcriptional regulator n=1 Tax=Streptomyces sp. NPDC048231 TaxID=3365519 RepID=UPI00371A3730
METEQGLQVSDRDRRRADVIAEAAGRLFFASGFAGVSMDDLARELGMSKKTIYRHFPNKRSLLAEVLDRKFAAVESRLRAVEEAEVQPFGVRVEQFLIAAGSELERIGAAQLATGRGDAMLRHYVEQRMDTVVYRRLDELFREAHQRELLSAPPELLSEITRGALERLVTSRLPRELHWTAADLLRTTVDTVLYGAIRPVHRGVADKAPRAVVPAARDDEHEVSP